MRSGERVIRAIRAIRSARGRLPTSRALTTLSCGAALSLAAGCGDVVPREGVWIHDPGVITEDTCNLGDQTATDPYGEFVIADLEGDRFTIITDADESFSCTLLGDGLFECPNRVVESFPADGNYDATLNINVRVDGTFTTERDAEGEQTFSAECVGADCDNPLLLAVFELVYPDTTLPCQYKVAFTAVGK